MKKLFTMLLLVTFSLSIWSCQYDDKDLWNEIENIKTELTRLNQEVGAIQTLVNALNQKKTITSVDETDTGCSITFSDGKIITIKNGTNAPQIGVEQFDGVYYWIVGDSGNWLTDSQGNKIPVSGKDGVSPKIAVDTDGYWTLDGIRITDASGNEVQVSGSGQPGIPGKDGDSFFESVTDGEEVTFVLTNGETIIIPKVSTQIFGFEKPTDGRDYYVFDFGKKQTLALRTDDIVTAEIMNAPDDWNVKIDIAKKSLIVQAPAVTSGVSYSGGIITLIGIDKKGSTVFASVDVCASVDYTNADGTFIVCEGNMTSANGMLVFYDKNGKEYIEIFEQANGGKEIGNTVQDMYMANGKIYMITQNGNNMDGAGRFVVCDARTMRMVYADPLVIQTPEGKATWPQHLVITSDTKGYIQYSEAGAEATSGICEIALSEEKVEVKETVSGTFGVFTSVGAIKTRMVYSRGKVYAGCGHSIVIIDPATNSIEKQISYEGQQVKGVVKGADGNIWFTLAGTFTGNQNFGYTFTSNAKIVGIDHSGNLIQSTDMPSSIKLPVATWSPAVGMCASFTDPYIYFVDTDAFMTTTATRYNYSTNAFELNYISSSETIYGIMGMHPTTKDLWVGKSSYVDSNIYVYDVSGSSPSQKQMYTYPTQKGASPAGVDFTYRFTEEFITK